MSGKNDHGMWRQGRIAVFGATSGIARAVAEAWMARGEELLLIGRSKGDLEAIASDLLVAYGRRPPVFLWDITDFGGHAARFEALVKAHGPAGTEGGVGIKGLFLAAGVMYSQEECDRELGKAAHTFHTNLTGAALVANLFAAYLAAQGGGFLSVLSSVAGDRGRASNFTYGSSKAGLSAYLEGLRGALHGKGVLVQTVKPGPIRTRMTAGSSGTLMASPARAARDIVEAVALGREVVYTPGYWRLIMAVVRNIPSPLFKRLKL